MLMKQDKLAGLNQYLKNNFFGIDRIIDDICDKIAPWYVFPESFNRPLIINLWGMTGTGKTVLVREIVKYLKIKVIQVDLGEYVGEKSSSISNSFYEKYYDLSEKSPVILIDEFHIARTKNVDGSEIDRRNIRSLWNLLSDGVMIVDESYLNQTIDLLDYTIDNCMDSFKESQDYIKRHSKKRGYDWNLEQAHNNIKKPQEVFEKHGLRLASLAKILNCPSIADMAKNFKKDFLNNCFILKEKIKKAEAQPKLDYSKSLIFVVGNLDELYTGSEDFDPDIDLDSLKERNKNISLCDVKEELFKRFRVEQIGRLGNNHLIYPTLDKDAYYKIIEKDLIRIKKFYAIKGLDFEFDTSITEVIFNEGVFPNQGARSVLCTVGSLLEPALVNFYYKYKTSTKRKKVKVNCSYNFKSKNFDFQEFHAGSNITKIKAQLNLDVSREPVTNQKSMIASIHEAGHILSCVMIVGLIPRKASVFKVSGNGSVEFLNDSPKEELLSYKSYKDRIACALAGFTAEEIVFSKENVSLGASSDLKKATAYCLNLIQLYGYNEPVVTSGVNQDLGEKLFRNTGIENKCRRILKACKLRAQRIIQKNRPFLKDLADCLISQTSMNDKDVEKIMAKHKITCAEKINYKKKFDYAL